MIRDIFINFKQLWWKKWLIIISSLVIIAVFPLFISPYFISFIMSIAMYVILCASWNVISGYAGYISFGHVVFWGTGAYLTTIFINKLGVCWPIALISAGIGAALIATFISFPLLRLSGTFFAISMLAFTEAMGIAVAHFGNLTGGGGGTYIIPLISLNTAYFLMVGLASFLLLLMLGLQNTKFIYSLKAIRGNEIAADTLGINTVVRKRQAFVFSAFPAAIAGSIYVLNVCFISPHTAFDITITLRVIMMTVLGGIGTVLGPLIGPIVFNGIAELLWARFPFIHKAILGVVVIIIVLVIPNGVVPLLNKLFKKKFNTLKVKKQKQKQVKDIKE